ncbi:hypothetical protein OJF2_51180 [Aquisphaera giovannonii]|uniref:Uncharacterized protein n=1 Tax=Aquisphaera giovannonii TaxID=406548 RepID=A0A5B9W8G5_9BACT|nr:hypothetical protein [Aquisphaera giovannonii]QEH36534.1 hypothetical protein OJF2_51180 [Aquisphaera giovannonii]
MIAAFIRKHGVTACPATGTKELAALNIEREKLLAEQVSRDATRRWRNRFRPKSGVSA